jgi:hypothetical protein
MLSPALCFSQDFYEVEWIRQFDEQDARSVMFGPTGSILVGTGSSLRTYNTSGDLQSVISTPVPTMSMVLDDDGNIYACGRSRDPWVRPSAGQSDSVFTKLDPQGNILWMRQWGGTYADGCRNVVIDPFGDILTSGYENSKTFVRKFDSAGNQLWLSNPTGSNDGAGLAVDSLGNAVVTGYGNAPYSQTATISNLRSNGSSNWNRQLDSVDYDYANAAVFDADGSVYVTGATAGVLGESHGLGYDVFVAKFDADGNQQWISQLGAGFFHFETGRDILLAPNGDILVVGETTSASDLDNIFIAKLSSSGELLWTSRQLPVLPKTSQYDLGFAIAMDELENLYVVGDTRGSLGGPNAGEWDGFLMKLAPTAVPEPRTGIVLLIAAAFGWAACHKRMRNTGDYARPVQHL